MQRWAGWNGWGRFDGCDKNQGLGCSPVVPPEGASFHEKGRQAVVLLTDEAGKTLLEGSDGGGVEFS